MIGPNLALGDRVHETLSIATFSVIGSPRRSLRVSFDRLRSLAWFCEDHRLATNCKVHATLCNPLKSFRAFSQPNPRRPSSRAPTCASSGRQSRKRLAGLDRVAPRRLLRCTCVDNAGRGVWISRPVRGRRGMPGVAMGNRLARRVGFVNGCAGLRKCADSQ